MTKEFVELLTDEALLDQFADCYGQTVFCEGCKELEKEVEILRSEILRRMSN